MDVILPGKDGTFEQYRSRVEEINSQRIAIAMPMKKGAPVFLVRGESFYGQTVSDGVIYKFTSTFINKLMNPIPLWIVTLPTDITKIQQRSFVRYEAMIPVRVKILDDGNDNKADSAFLDALTKDISGGGVQLVVKQQLPAGAKLKIAIDFPGLGSICVTGQIIRVQQPQPDKPVFWTAVNFVDIDEKDRNIIIKYIFKKQLEQRRKEL
ncbi:MAG TPA: flagellar brake domain-containing protein [Methylomusa anaerophila]|uniref:Flagellar brake protein YcgR n=1 Tax=Methylomusa anaerophila TaxID=1930071 RepID=A0A348AQ17_9FIRM|nr:flagellar brake domain-containing protein [Methylomusa anaerophila]BBB93165.1 flagellar brake protein YcgR [Methylomusa anaerophila]HML87003.1 flagellar brake domain-containing protein [Methylomusa anaerophila]